jgi:hypothetical protein
MMLKAPYLIGETEITHLPHNKKGKILKKSQQTQGEKGFSTFPRTYWTAKGLKG